MFAACQRGDLNIGKWLFDAGASEDIHSKTNYGTSSMFTACCKSHLDVAKWLFKVGAVEGIRIQCKGVTPMQTAV